MSGTLHISSFHTKYKNSAKNIILIICAKMMMFHLDGMVEEGSMHGLSDDFHPPEGERQVGQSSTYPGPR